MKSRSLLILILSALSVTLPSCRHRGFRHMSEGEIFYNITYVRNPSSLPNELLPKELKVIFKDDKILTILNAPFGNSGITSLTNPEEEVFDTYLNLFSFKYSYEGKKDEIQPGLSAMNDIAFRETGNTSAICGFNCRQVAVVIPGSDSVRYVWYTRDIDVSHPNAATPFRDIDGVLMDFFYIMGEAEITFTADEVFVKEIHDKEFERRENYKKVSKSYIESLIVKMMTY